MRGNHVESTSFRENNINIDIEIDIDIADREARTDNNVGDR